MCILDLEVNTQQLLLLFVTENIQKTWMKIESFLTERIQNVLIASTTFNCIEVNQGVPQEKVLGRIF